MLSFVVELTMDEKDTESPAEPSGLTDREIAERRRIRQRRTARAAGRGGYRTLLKSPAGTIFCMLIALGSIVVYWGGLPSWALLVIGIVALIIVAASYFLLRPKGRTIREPGSGD